ncbi:MAG: PorT family protein [Ignavibacteria bacterium]|nr:PorT family protein [Ignavibacteria bacterium]
MIKLIILISAFIFSLPNYGQIIVSVGLKGGITITDYTQWNSSDTIINKLYVNRPESRILVNIALYAEGLSTKYFSTVGEIAYNPKGVSFTYNALNGNGNIIGTESVDNRTGYLSVSLCEKARVNWKKMNLFIYAGPRLDMQINENRGLDFYETYKKFETMIFGLSAGFGIEFVDRKYRFITEVQFEPDLTFTLNNTIGKVKKNTWLVRIGVALNEK